MEWVRRSSGTGAPFYRNLQNLACDMMIAKFLADIMPPIPWDVELARWFEERFPDLENLCQTQQKARSHARYS